MKLDLAEEASPLAGKVLIIEFDPQLRSRLRSILPDGRPLLTILVDPNGVTTRGRPGHRLEDSDEPGSAGSPRITLTGEAAAQFYAALKPGTQRCFHHRAHRYVCS